MQQKSLKILVKIFGFFMLNIYILFLKLTALGRGLDTKSEKRYNHLGIFICQEQQEQQEQ
jgi:hypothetical protein